MRFLTRTRFDFLRSVLVIAGVLILLLDGTAAAASLNSSIGTYSGTTSQGQHFTFFVVDSACLATNSPERLCLYASGPNNVELTVGTTCPAGGSGSSYGVDLDPTSSRAMESLISDRVFPQGRSLATSCLPLIARQQGISSPKPMGAQAAGSPSLLGEPGRLSTEFLSRISGLVTVTSAHPSSLKPSARSGIAH